MLSKYFRRLAFERLEDRQLLAVLTVNTLVDENGSGPNLSLREAVNAANNGDIIQFAVTGQIDLGLSGGGHITVDQSITIQGPGWHLLTVRAFDPDSGGNNDSDGRRVFLVDNNSSLLDVTISGLTFTNGDPQEADENTGGGAILNRENLTINNCVFNANFAPNGGAILNSGGALVINDSTISNNGGADGAGLLVEGGSLVVNRSWILDNDSSNSGGGILARGRNVTINESRISGNMTDEHGGGFYQYQGSLTINNSIISSNVADDNHDETGEGGGIYNLGGSLAITQATISGNTAHEGGGIFSNTGSTPTVSHSTITGNVIPTSSGTSGGGINSTDTMDLKHTIVAGNLRGATTRDDVSGDFDAEYSLIGDRRSANVDNDGGSLIGTTSTPINAMLAPLGNNGGPTMTHLLLSGSPAIDAGNPAFGSVPAFDQRGTTFGRKVDYDGVGGVRIDMGAVEMVALPAAPAQPGDYNRDATVNAGDFVLWRKTNGTSVSTAYAGADGDGNTSINQNDYTFWRSNFGKPAPASGAQPLLWTTSIESPAEDGPSRANVGEADSNAVVADLAIELLLVTRESGEPLVGQVVDSAANKAEGGSSDASDAASELPVVWQGL